MVQRYQCLCAKEVLRSFEAIKTKAIRVCGRIACGRWQHSGCSDDPAFQEKRDQHVTCNSCYATVAAEKDAKEKDQKMHRPPKGLFDAKHVQQEIWEPTAEDKMAEKIQAMKQAMEKSKQNRLVAERAETDKQEAIKRSKLAESKDEDLQADQIRQKRKTLEAERVEQELVERQKQADAKRQKQEYEEAERKLKAVEDARIEQGRQAVKTAKAEELRLQQERMQRKTAKYQEKQAALKTKLQKLSEAQQGACRAPSIAKGSFVSITQGQSIQSNSDETSPAPDAQIQAVAAVPAVKLLESWSGSSSKSTDPKGDNPNPLLHLHAYAAATSSDFTSKVSAQHVPASGRERPPEPPRDLLHQLKGTLRPGTFDKMAGPKNSKRTMTQATNTVESSDEDMVEIPLPKRKKTQQPDLTAGLTRSNGGEGAMIKNRANIDDTADKSEKSAKMSASASSIPALGIWSNTPRGNLPRIAHVVPTETPDSNHILDAIIAHACQELLWPSYCDLPEGPAESAKVTRLTRMHVLPSGRDGPAEKASEDWVQQLHKQILLLLDAAKPEVRAELHRLLKDGDRRTLIRALSTEMVFACNKGNFSKPRNKRLELAILMEVVGMARRGKYWHP